MNCQNALGSGMACEAIAFAAGGTGGHVSPAVALAEAFQEHHPEFSLYHLSGSRSAEQLITFPGERVEMAATRFQKSQPFKTSKQLLASISEAYRWLQKSQVRAVIATGGYSCFPALCGARLLSIPYWLLEQNQILGRVTRLFSYGAQDVFGPRGCPHPRAKPLGVPVRQEIQKIKRPSQRNNPLRVLVSGGSQGSLTLDHRLPLVLTMLSQKISLEIFHFQSSQTEKLSYGSEVTCTIKKPSPQFLDKLLWADVVIGRAGGSTLAECNALGLPQVLIPLPSAQDNHQWHNAKFQEKSGAAICLEEKEDNQSWLERLQNFFQTHQLDLASQAAQKLHTSDLSQNMAQSIVAHIEKTL